MSIVLLGSTSGSCTLQEQAVAGTTTLTLPTTSGTVALTSDITTAAVLTATAGLTAGDVGTYMWGGYRGAGGPTAIPFGSTTAGSNLAPAGIIMGSTALWPTNVPNSFFEIGVAGAAVRSGTWRCLGTGGQYPINTSSTTATLWIRIS
jgi:hypothetical protein